MIELIEKQLPGAITDSHAFRGDVTIVVVKEKFLDVVDLIFKDGYQLLVDITAVDWQERQIGDCPVRFDVVYHWLNLTSQERLRIKVPVADGESMPSLVAPNLQSHFKTADWFEREVFDLFGISFDGHPNMSRLLTWTDFSGHALRKDFPLDGGDPFCMADSTAPYAKHLSTTNP
jgi:NADH-quinone oxidoreductase subunit C